MENNEKGVLGGGCEYASSWDKLDGFSVYLGKHNNDPHTQL